MHVPLKLRLAGSITHGQGEQSDADNLKSGDLAGVVKDINATCYEYQREEVRRTICRVCFISNLHQFVFTTFLHR
jgi:nuclear pore complex protein Nup85